MTKHAAVLRRMQFGKGYALIAVAGAAHPLSCFFTLYAVGLQRLAMIIILWYAQRCLIGGKQPQAHYNHGNQQDKSDISLANFHIYNPGLSHKMVRIDPLV